MGGAEDDEGSHADAPTRVSAETTSSAALLSAATEQPVHVPLADLLKAQVLGGALGNGGAGGARLGRYALLRVLGEGGMGVVFAAYDEELDRKVAIKLLRTKDGVAPESSWLLSEAKAMARLSHPNIVQVYDVGACDGQLFLAMEFIVGNTLLRWLRERPRGWREVVPVCLQAGRGLQAAHEAGLVHRDFKPKSRRPSQTAPQPTDRPHSRELGRFERVSLLRLAPHCPALPQVLAKRWQRADLGTPRGQRGRPALVCLRESPALESPAMPPRLGENQEKGHGRTAGHSPTRSAES